ncbi:MAG: HK97 gp10 family phage protein [Gordonia sp. (in: high G+C Gram-positive bacteria)]|uniref:HK97 gp10 family phage protein n=1 Tax=Gordonia sp. (in: high G+C Gram-positive bacteria) TaxID=84139 RepID=UPI0039E56B68
MTVRARLNSGQVKKEIHASSVESRREIAEQAAADARTAAPVLTGAYRDGIGAVAHGDEVLIVDDDPAAIPKEYGTSDTPAHASLITAASRYGHYYGTRPGS